MTPLIDIYFSTKPYIYIQFCTSLQTWEKKEKKKVETQPQYIEDFKNHSIHNSKKKKKKKKTKLEYSYASVSNCLIFQFYFSTCFYPFAPYTVLPICKACCYIQCRQEAISVISSGFIILYFRVFFDVISLLGVHP